MRHKSWRLVQSVLVVAALVCVGCTSIAGIDIRQGSASNDGASEVVVASFDFSESRVLAEIYASALEDGGYGVTRHLDLGSREVVAPALFQDKVDLVPEYLGSALEFVSLGKVDVTSHPRAMHRELSRALLRRGVEVLAYAPAQDQNAVAVTASTAARFGLRKVSDLRGVAPQLVFGGPPECPERPHCLKGLREEYGLEFKSFVSLDAAGPVTVTALDNGEVDVATLFTTNPSISVGNLVLLRDDRRLQPAESIAPLVRTETIDEHGHDLVRLLNSVTRRLSTDDLRALNGKVELQGSTPAEAARSWLSREGLGR